MRKKIVGVVGSYQAGGIIEQTVDAIVDAADQKGADVDKIILRDRHIEFCTNCRACTVESADLLRGSCVLEDDMEVLLNKIDAADGIVLASPINFSSVTAIMKRFIERLVVYAYWPYEQHIPKSRIKNKIKKAVIVTSSACPTILGRLIMPNANAMQKEAAKLFGAKVVKSLHFGSACYQKNQQISENQRRAAQVAGALLV